MTGKTYTSIVTKRGRLMLASMTGLAFYQPEVDVNYGSASDTGLPFVVSVEEVLGNATSWKLKAAFQLCQFGVSQGAPGTSWDWYDVEEGQKSFMLPVGDFESQDASLTNISPNPSLETGATGWGQVNGAGGSATGSHETSAGYHGVGFRRASWYVATTVPSGGQHGPLTTVTPGRDYTFGMAVRESKKIRGRFGVRWDNGNVTWGPSRVVPANEWVYGGLHVTVPAGRTTGACFFEASGTAGVDGALNRENGDTQDVDAHLVAEGHVPVVFTDGTETIVGEKFLVASSGDILPTHRSRMIRGFGERTRLRFWFEAVGATSGFGLVLSITNP